MHVAAAAKLHGWGAAGLNGLLEGLTTGGLQHSLGRLPEPSTVLTHPALCPPPPPPGCPGLGLAGGAQVQAEQMMKKATALEEKRARMSPVRQLVSGAVVIKPSEVKAAPPEDPRMRAFSPGRASSAGPNRMGSMSALNLPLPLSPSRKLRNSESGWAEKPRFQGPDLAVVRADSRKASRSDSRKVRACAQVGVDARARQWQLQTEIGSS